MLTKARTQTRTLTALLLLIFSLLSNASTPKSSIVTVTSAGTPVRLTTSGERACVVNFQADTANTNNTYVGISTLNKTTRAGVLAILAAGAGITFNVCGKASSTGDLIELKSFYIDADTNSNIAVVSWVN